MSKFTTAIGKLNAIADAELGASPKARRHKPARTYTAEEIAWRQKVAWMKDYRAKTGCGVFDAAKAFERATL